MDIAIDPQHDSFNSVLEAAVRIGASDVHLSEDEHIFFRHDGSLQPVGQVPLPAERVRHFVRELLAGAQPQELESNRHIDVGYTLAQDKRFRINVYHSCGKLNMAVRRLDETIRTVEELCLPPQVGDLAGLPNGLVLVTGATGSGKSTTLAALIDQINRSRRQHIITIEDPIEYLHSSRSCLVHQRELHTDVPSFADAVRAAMREDPDVILVGEMRDAATMRAAIMAAETGHLVFSTLHTNDAVGAIDRILGVFKGQDQDAVRLQLSMVLRAVVAQRLLPRIQGGRVVAVEFLRATTAVSHLVRSGKAPQIYSAMEAGSADGMQTFEKALADLVGQEEIELDTAIAHARDPELVRGWLKRSAMETANKDDDTQGLLGRRPVRIAPKKRLPGSAR